MALRLMFAKIADRYDLLNHVLTFGLDIFWRVTVAKECKSHGVILDLCCGTGELLFHLSKFASPNTLLVGIDFTKPMLRKAMGRKTLSEKTNYKESVQAINFILADAANLPIRDGCIDFIGMSFSFRNLVFKNPSADTYLREILRVLRVGGKFAFIETSQPKAHPLKLLLHFYLRKIVPSIGGFISGYKPAYRYLGTSAINFPTAEEVKKMLKKKGFNKVSYKHVTWGIVAIHVCRK